MKIVITLIACFGIIVGALFWGFATGIDEADTRAEAARKDGYAQGLKDGSNAAYRHIANTLMERVEQKGKR